MQELTERMSNFFELIPKKKWHYFHKKSMDNFIYHLPDIANEKTRGEIVEKIQAYLSEIESWPLIDAAEANIRTSEKLYHAHVKYLGGFYDAYMGFAFIFAPNTFFVLIPSIAVFIYLIRNSQIILTIFITISLIYWGRIIYKATDRKICGFGY